MLRIASIDIYPVVLPVREIYGGAAGFLEDCRSLIVRVEIEDGLEGWGEATQGRPGNTYERLATIMRPAPAIRWLKPLLRLRSMTPWRNSIMCRFTACSAAPTEKK